VASPPGTTLSSSRPPRAWSSVAAWRAEAVGPDSEVRKATSSLMRWVAPTRLEAVTQGSRQELPVGISSPS